MEVELHWVVVVGHHGLGNYMEGMIRKGIVNSVIQQQAIKNPGLELS